MILAALLLALQLHGSPDDAPVFDHACHHPKRYVVSVVQFALFYDYSEIVRAHSFCRYCGADLTCSRRVTCATDGCAAAAAFDVLPCD